MSINPWGDIKKTSVQLSLQEPSEIKKNVWKTEEQNIEKLKYQIFTRCVQEMKLSLEIYRTLISCPTLYYEY